MERLHRKFILKYFSIIFQSAKPILRNIHIKTVLTTVNNTIGLLRKFQQLLTGPSLINIFRAFVRPYLDFGDVVFDQNFNNCFMGD